MVDKVLIPESFYLPEARDFIVDKDRKRLWAVLLDLLDRFMIVCGRHGIKFFVDSGTLLGAVRHQGFIPWDDDVDLIMTRSEYEKLLKVADDFKAPYFLQTPKSDPTAARGHAQLRNSETTAILSCEMRDGKPLYGFNQGVFIDIFVLDNIPDDDKAAAAFMKKLSRLKKKIRVARDAETLWKFGWYRRRCNFLKVFKCKIMSLAYRLFRSESYLDALQSDFEKTARTYENQPSKRCSHLTLKPNPKPKNIYEKRFFEGGRSCRFEFLEVPVPLMAEEYLSMMYGDWRKYVTGGSFHGGMFIDLDNSYRKYTSV